VAYRLCTHGQSTSGVARSVLNLSPVIGKGMGPSGGSMRSKLVLALVASSVALAATAGCSSRSPADTSNINPYPANRPKTGVSTPVPASSSAPSAVPPSSSSGSSPAPFGGLNPDAHSQPAGTRLVLQNTSYTATPLRQGRTDSGAVVPSTVCSAITIVTAPGPAASSVAFINSESFLLVGSAGGPGGTAIAMEPTEAKDHFDYPIVAEPNQPLTHSMCWSTARSPGGTQFVLLLNPYAPPPQIEKCFDGWLSAVR